MTTTTRSEATEKAARARAASRRLASTSTDARNRALMRIADALEAETPRILAVNAPEVERGRAKLTEAFLDRMVLTAERIAGIARDVRQVASLPDPLGGIEEMVTRPNGLQIGKMRVPLGVIGAIYESRPNVTVDIAAICIKSGNAVVLRGGSEAIHSNAAIAEILREALSAAGLPADAVSFIPITERAAIDVMLAQEDSIDLIIPRGGEGLIRSVAEKSRIPVIKHYKGVCHIYVDEDADVAPSVRVCVNAKAQRPGVCNAMETLLVHEAIAPAFLPEVAEAMSREGVALRGCPETVRLVPGTVPATEADWGTEYLDLILAVRVVSSMDAAMEHIRRHGSLHTEAILTRDHARAMRFLREVDSSLVLVNASTRFNDGYQLGLGAEIGISTTKIHAFGPMGLEELTTSKFVAFGDGQVRQ